jgi:DNA-binding response OmpR family regulator
MKVLLIDDSKMQQRIAGIYMGKEDGFCLITADSGAEGVKKAVSEKPDIILLDIYMPEMSGEEVLKELKANDVTGKIPVIMCTGYFDALTRETFLKLGAYDFLYKPHGYKELIYKIGGLGAPDEKQRGNV